MKLIISPNSLTIRFCKWFNRLYFRYKKIHFGKNMQVYNKVYITGNRGNINIGDDFHFTSGGGINPIAKNIRGCIHTNHTDSEITIGNHVGISSACIYIMKRLTIGNYVDIGANCTIMDSDVHQLDYLARRGEKSSYVNDVRTTVQSAPVTIEDDVWIGAHCIILKGVTIGARSIIGAGSVVTKNIPADCIAAGNPCKVIKVINKNG
jgi:acetyltransferase-like isoleucine patch superfamily enzyme